MYNKLMRLMGLTLLLMSVVVGVTGCGDSSQSAKPAVAAVDVTSTPLGAVIFANGNRLGVTPCRIGLPLSRTILLTASLAGHRPKMSLFEATSAPAGHSVKFDLEPYQCGLAVKSNPEGAQITVDGAAAGAAPLTLFSLGVGEHIVRAERHGYLPKESKVIIPPDGSPAVVNFNMESILGSLKVTSPTPEVSVFVNGKSVGFAPYQASVGEGTYDVVLKKEGFTEVQRRVEVRRQQETLLDLPLADLPASLVITTQPEGATLFFEGEMRGASPLTLQNLKPGRYMVKAQKAGYDTEEVSVRVSRGVTTPITVNLTANTGEIHVTALPPGVSVYIDGARVGSVESDAVDSKKSKVFVIRNLASKSYQVKIAHKDGKPAFVTQTVSVPKGGMARTDPMKIWVPNAWIHTVVSQEPVKVFLEYESPTEVVFQPYPGVTRRYRRDEVKKIEPFDIREAFEKGIAK